MGELEEILTDNQQENLKDQDEIQQLKNMLNMEQGEREKAVRQSMHVQKEKDSLQENLSFQLEEYAR